MQGRSFFILPIPPLVLLLASSYACSHRSILHDLASPGSAELKLVVRLDQSAAVIDEIMSSPDKGIPHEILDRAICVVVLPGVQDYSLVVGAEWGSGFVSCRNKNGVGWTAPGTVSLRGGSFGLQIGTRETNMLLLVMNRSAESKLLSNDFTIGADASAAAGPVGRSVGAATNAVFKAEILSWSQASGLFAGVALEGSTVRQDESALQVLYGREITNREVVLGQKKTPKDAQRLIRVLDRYSPRTGS
jgi:lipid-binding SYLF domain-containing protein